MVARRRQDVNPVRGERRRDEVGSAAQQGDVNVATAARQLGCQKRNSPPRSAVV